MAKDCKKGYSLWQGVGKGRAEHGLREQHRVEGERESQFFSLPAAVPGGKLIKVTMVNRGGKCWRDWSIFCCAFTKKREKKNI